MESSFCPLVKGKCMENICMFWSAARGECAVQCIADDLVYGLVTLSEIQQVVDPFKEME